jgi:alkanesulfonate monooxygenase SsuD/methylene tetrahydromethanopterin reductase-like flavin-dependent oxidoreductase (luciferase family)
MDAVGTFEVGISIIPDTDSLDRSREPVRIADEGGLRLVGIQDHPYQARFLDTFALIATLLAETHRIAFFTDVANLPLRPPAVMAKAAASLDVLSGGRFELGLGAGAFQDQVVRMGGPRRGPSESVDALEEAIEVSGSCGPANASSPSKDATTASRTRTPARGPRTRSGYGSGV